MYAFAGPALETNSATSKLLPQREHSFPEKAASQHWERPLLIPKVEDGEPSSAEVCETSSVPLLSITDLTEITPRFVIEGKVLNNYGTYKMSDPKFPMYFKVDIVDKHSSDTITVVVSSSLSNRFIEKLPVGTFVRVEGAAIRRKNKGDGGSSSLSLHVDSMIVVHFATPCPVRLSFLQSENLEMKSGSTRGELIVADGPTPADRAMDEYNSFLKETDPGKLVMRVARNVGAFMGREDTLSVMDLAVLVPVYSKRMHAELTRAFEGQVRSFGYGKEITGVLSFVNVNSVLVERVCRTCKSNKVHRAASGDQCVACNKRTTVLEVPKLQGRIRLFDDTVVHAQLVGDIVDRVLHLGKSFHQLYAESVLNTREVLACTSRAAPLL
ncbi:hypothetical protein GOP47_0014962 [Adiantum capillus-veneris]|uniref:Uncharacterized protein n=1 Tax=Adiantum capillus-veneris TaxID=13818 RepID=A0A9D4UN24_ADICA|nr:hypothetical protein GOP47_0014962 [Adiantum capillus-veneris]